MKIVRTVVWVLLLVALLIFSALNWEVVEVTIWPGAGERAPLIIETKIPALVVVAFLIGLVPMWMVHRASRWNYDRRIASLESAARASAMAPIAPPPEPVAVPVPAPATRSHPDAPRDNLSPTDEAKPAP